MNPWIQTVSGAAVDLIEPDLSHVGLNDIAWSLSRIARFNGHTDTSIPYSVAQHSVHVARLVEHLGLPREAQFAALMHDAHEAFIGDIPTPVKRAIGDAIKALDSRLEEAVRTRFGLATEFRSAIKAADLCALIEERHRFMADQTLDWGLLMDMDPRFDFCGGPHPENPVPPGRAMTAFIGLAYELRGVAIVDEAARI